MCTAGPASLCGARHGCAHLVWDPRGRGETDLASQICFFCIWICLCICLLYLYLHLYLYLSTIMMKIMSMMAFTSHLTRGLGRHHLDWLVGRQKSVAHLKIRVKNFCQSQNWFQKVFRIASESYLFTCCCFFEKWSHSRCRDARMHRKQAAGTEPMPRSLVAPLWRGRRI